MRPLDLNRATYQAFSLTSDVKKGQALTYHSAEPLTLRAVTSATDFVIGFSRIDYKDTEPNAQVFMEDGEVYALNGAKSIEQGGPVVVNHLGKLYPANPTQSSIGYALEPIEAETVGAIRFERLSQREFELVEFNANVLAGQGVKQDTTVGTVTAVNSTTDITYGFALNKNNSGTKGHIYIQEGNRVKALAAGVNLAKNIYVKCNGTGKLIIANANKDHVVGITTEAILKNKIGEIIFTRLILNI